MLSELMQTLSSALYASFPIALGASFLWGLMSMVLSPCHMVSVPLVMGYLASNETRASKRRYLSLALFFALGMTISIAVIGIVTSLLGRLAGDIGSAGNIIISIVLVYVGFSITGLVDLPLLGKGQDKLPSGRGAPGAVIMGLILGAALGPCTFAFMAPVLALMFQLGGESLIKAILLGVFFAVGHGTVVVFAGSFTDKVQKLLDWSESSRTAKTFRVVCGALVILGGLYLLKSVI